jgi:hypothetical protein
MTIEEKIIKALGDKWLTLAEICTAIEAVDETEVYIVLISSTAFERVKNHYRVL